MAQCNHCGLNTAKLISNSDELSRFLETISENKFLENFLRHDTKCIYLSTINITFYVNKLEKTPIGQFDTLPNFLLHNQGINSLIADVCETPYRDHLCFFHYLTLSLPRSSIDDLVFSVFPSNFF